MKQTCAIIGSGIAGISAAIRMAVKGYKVTVFEQSGMAGGKISELRLDGFRFDTGPSLFTLPELVDELYVLCGKNPRDAFNYIPLKASCRYFWENGMKLTAWSNPEQFACEVEKNSGVPGSRVLGFLKKCRELYELVADVFLFDSFHRAGNYLKPAFRRSLLHLHKLDAFTSMHKRNQKWFKQPAIVQLFDRYATYNGSNPYKTPATLNVIAHLEHERGAWFPEKGMYDIAASLHKLAVEMGVNFQFNTRVLSVVFDELAEKQSLAKNEYSFTKWMRRPKKRQVKGLRLPGGIRLFDMIISDVDIVHLYRELIPGEAVPSKQLKLSRSSSALIFYWGIKGDFQELDLHNILFSDDYKKEFDHLFETKTISPDPSIYIFISSKAVRADAPAGHENWYVMINAPENIGQDWDVLVKQARAHIISKINRVLKTDIETHIVAEAMKDPRHIERETASTNGSLYGLSSNGMFAAFNRHPNFKRKFKNLYFTGGSVHPGGGIPLCLASAKIADDEIMPADQGGN